MSTGSQSHTGDDAAPDADSTPAISVCESRPGRSVFIESGNADGWIASDATTEVRR